MAKQEKPKDSTQPRDAAYWAKSVDRFKVQQAPTEGLNLNVDGREIAGPLQGFGQMWQKTYRVRLTGADISATELIRVWKQHFPEFWPRNNRFYAPLTGIEPGEVAVLNLSMPGRLPLSTGVMVIYADEESFSFMNPVGHIFAAMITFSGYEEDGTTVAQIQALVRASDPAYELMMRLGIGHRMEDRFWQYTLRSLARHFGVDGKVEQEMVLIDPRVQWRHANYLWQNAFIRSFAYLPYHLLRKTMGRRRSKAA